MCLSRSRCHTGRTYQIAVALDTISCSLFLETLGSQDSTNPPSLTSNLKATDSHSLLLVPHPPSILLGVPACLVCRLHFSLHLKTWWSLSNVHSFKYHLYSFNFHIYTSSSNLYSEFQIHYTQYLCSCVTGNWKLIFSTFNSWALHPKPPPATVSHISANSNSVFQLHGQNSRIRQNDMWVSKREVKKQTKRKFLIVILNFAKENPKHWVKGFSSSF